MSMARLSFLRPSALAGPIWWWRSRIAGSTSRAWLTSGMSPHNLPVRTAHARAHSHNIVLVRADAQFGLGHGLRPRVAKKYMNLTLRFFPASGVAGYRIVESVGATEATPAAGTAAPSRGSNHTVTALR